MDVSDDIKGSLERLQANSGVKRVFGEPIREGDKTIIPVAKLAYGFGGGSGEKTASEKPGESGTGVGGGLAIKPLGVVEVGPQGTRYVPIADTGRLLAAVGAGMLLGMLLSRR